VIFIDRSIPKSVASALKAVRDDVAWLEDMFRHDTRDTDWLRDAGKSGWLVISRDKRIRTRPGERAAILENRVGCFIVTVRQNPTRWGYLKLLCATLDEMQRLFEETARPFVFTVDSRLKPKRVA
jgi:predicted nuclease of predicted toxin-antitoxin system